MCERGCYQVGHTRTEGVVLPIAPTPLIASAPAFKNCDGVGRENDGRLRSGEDDGVRVECDEGDEGIGIGIGGIGITFWMRRSGRFKPAGTYVGIEGDESGVNKPLLY